jgi:asparagine synthase (glutamine-hydrolysing)
MCGIFGFFGRRDPAILDSMAGFLAHRGPDDRGLYFDAAHGVGLGQVRLSIIDLSRTGHQPMWDASGRFVVVYNGEIYNYKELRTELKNEGVVFRGDSDTEVLLELYARLGSGMLTRLNGMFAFAVWDLQKRELFLARDGLGVKPLYWTQGVRSFAFSSELKGLLPVLERRTLDAASLHRYLSYLWCPGEGTPILEVKKLNPGEAMVVFEGRIQRRWTWYELPIMRQMLSPLEAGLIVPSTESILRRAVHRQLVSDVPIGAFLSGGLDSSAIVAFARDRMPDLHCFTIEIVGKPDAGFVDDLPYARRVALHLGLPLEVVSVDSEHMAQDLQEMVWMLDEPLADPAPLNLLYMCRLARKQGIKVLLSGAGGDDLFGGYRRHLALQFEQLWSWLPQAARTALTNGSESLGGNLTISRRLQRLLSNVKANGNERMAGYFSWMQEPQLHNLYSLDFMQQLGSQRADAPLVSFLEGVSPDRSSLDRMLALEQRFFLADHNLTYTDRMSMRAGVEVRVPFLDPELVEHASRIPDRFKQRGTIGKWVLKKTMEPYLPHAVIYRPKTGFGAPLRRWLKKDLSGLTDDLLSQRSLEQRGIFSYSSVRALRKANEEGRVDAAYTLLSVINIEIWCRRFVDTNNLL